MQIQRIQQISESHCGPAVLAMLLAYQNVFASQNQIAALAGAEKTIEEEGTQPDQLGLAASKIAPQLQFWYKDFSTIDDIEYLLSKGIPVAVEWQGLFYDSVEEEPPDREGDFGHYSIITYIDRDLNNIIIVDPYKDYPQNRFFSLEFFEKRWYDSNDVFDPISGQEVTIKDTRLLFFLAPLNEEIDYTRKFKRFSKNTHQHWRHQR